MRSSVPSTKYQIPSGARFQVWDPQAATPNFSTKHHSRKGVCDQKTEDDGEDHVTRDIRLSDTELLHLALNAAESVDWQMVRQPPDAWTEAKSTKTRKSTVSSGTSTSVYTQQAHKNHANPSSIAVMAHTIVPCSLRELMLVIESTRSDQFCDVMQVVHSNAIVSTKIVHHVDAAKTLTKEHRALPSSGSLIKVVALEKKTRSSNPFRTRPRDCGEWRYLDFVQHISAKAVRKTIVSLPPLPGRPLVGEEVEALKYHQRSHELLVGYQFEELEDGKSTRILFWGDHLYDQSGGALNRLIADRVANSRMLRLAESVDRFMLVVRRRRLGVQVVADKIKVQLSNPACACCNRSLLLTRKKMCNLCGYYVCAKCSQLEDHERKAAKCRKPSVSLVNIYRKCIVRVDQCSYTNVSLENLSPPRIDALAKRSSPVATTTAATKPTSLLQESLQSAPESRKSSVLKIVKYIVSNGSQTPQPTLTNESTEKQHFDALQATLRDPPLPLSECKLADTEQRSCLIDHSNDPAASHLTRSRLQKSEGWRSSDRAN